MLRWLSPSQNATHAVLIGAGLMLLGDFTFSANDALGKWLIMRHSTAELLTFRTISGVFFMIPMVWRMGPDAVFVMHRWPIQALRVCLVMAETVCFYSAVRVLPLADVMTFYLASPIFTAAVSPWALGESVDRKRWLAIGVGFIGVIVALRPSSSALTVAALWSLSGSFLYAMLIVTSRKMRDVPDLTIVFQQFIGVLVFAGLWYVSEGASLAVPSDIPLLGLLGIVAMCAHFCINRALKFASAAVIAPVQYSLLLWAIVFGYVFFEDKLDLPMLIGAGIIILAGIFLFDRHHIEDPPT